MNRDETGHQFGDLLREHRRAAGLSQDELARRAGLSASAISALERGERRQPYPHTVRVLATALQLSDDDRAELLRSAGRGPAPAPAPTPPKVPRSRWGPLRSAGVVTLAVVVGLVALLAMRVEPGHTSPSAVLLPVPYRSQQQTNWADPAVLEMWLRFDHAGGLPADDVSAQSVLWAYEEAHNDGFTLAEWDCSPYAVAVTFDHFAGTDAVGDDPFANADAAGKVISRVVGVRHEPVIALLDGATTWVLVVGVTLAPGGAGRSPQAVVVDDPYPAGQAREGGLSMGKEAHLSWQSFAGRFTPVPTSDPGIWSGRWVLIAPGIALHG